MEEDDTFNKAFGKVVQAIYSAKHNGRDTYCIYTEEISKTIKQ